MKLEKVAKEILKSQKELERLKKQSEKLTEATLKRQSYYEALLKKIERLNGNVEKMSKSKKDIESKMVEIISKDFAISLISKEDFELDSETVVLEELLTSYNRLLNQNFKKLKKNYDTINKNLSLLQNEREGIKKELEILKQQRKKAIELKEKKEKALEKLTKQKEEYAKALERLDNERAEIEKTLQKLNILKKSEIKKQKSKVVKKRDKNLPKVRQIGSSYQKSKVKRYRGPKTIAPLKSYKVIRKFGNYYDPVYNMKIFNESVVLRASKPNAKVRNVLNGKVIFSKDTPLLDKIVIIEHSRGLHTIYAHLSKIAPNIRVGSKIKKGVYIGRVDRDLTFEVTQKNYHINPMQLIK